MLCPSGHIFNSDSMNCFGPRFWLRNIPIGAVFVLLFSEENITICLQNFYLESLFRGHCSKELWTEQAKGRQQQNQMVSDIKRILFRFVSLRHTWGVYIKLRNSCTNENTVDCWGYSFPGTWKKYIPDADIFLVFIQLLWSIYWICSRLLQLLTIYDYIRLYST
jgi:hypothetical protein